MIIHFIFSIVSIYLCGGFVFALAFIFKGLRVVDKSAYESTIGFKIIILPATMVFWPFLLIKWMSASKNPGHD